MAVAKSQDANYYEQAPLWGPEHIENAEHLALRYDAIIDLLPGEARTVVELGSGDGRVLTQLKLRTDLRSSIGMDRSRAALAHQAQPGVVGAIEQVPLADRSVDAVLCCEVLEHLDHLGYAQARNELGRVADRWVIVTVPNRENLRRGMVTCPACGCRYSPIRHVRSFHPDDLARLVPGFQLTRLDEAGPKAVVYPRWLRLALERFGLLIRSGAPACPQCQAPLNPSADGSLGSATGLRTTSPRTRRLVPKSRRRYWLCALYEREPASRATSE